MHYVQKYLENFTNSNSVKVPNKNTKSSNNVYLYCSYYSFYSQKVCNFIIIYYLKFNKY